MSKTKPETPKSTLTLIIWVSMSRGSVVFTVQVRLSDSVTKSLESSFKEHDKKMRSRKAAKEIKRERPAETQTLSDVLH